ncbi:hypothetical protein BRD56_10750 [Thermoplasmatales archaeon SW_10_69_26]|nr:MAG: hypothetical protein BRD56_10750 [Thermoplasmatales archaeon SW_10_69_26]
MDPAAADPLSRYRVNVDTSAEAIDARARERGETPIEVFGEGGPPVALTDDALWLADDEAVYRLPREAILWVFDGGRQRDCPPQTGASTRGRPQAAMIRSLQVVRFPSVVAFDLEVASGYSFVSAPRFHRLRPSESLTQAQPAV